jgi:hypothetical protein
MNNSPLTNFELDIIEDILINNNKIKNKFDVKKIQYNSYYNTPEFWLKKWPKGYENIPHINLIVSDIIDKNQNNSPLQEISNLTLNE